MSIYWCIAFVDVFLCIVSLEDSEMNSLFSLHLLAKYFFRPGHLSFGTNGLMFESRQGKISSLLAKPPFPLMFIFFGTEILSPGVKSDRDLELKEKLSIKL